MCSFTVDFPLDYNRRSEIWCNPKQMTLWPPSEKEQQNVEVRKATFVFGSNPIKSLPLSVFSLQLPLEIGLWWFCPYRSQGKTWWQQPSKGPRTSTSEPCRTVSIPLQKASGPKVWLISLHIILFILFFFKWHKHQAKAGTIHVASMFPAELLIFCQV